ncbi:MAG: ABC transporter permease [Fimbriiglobus sp.]|nr:ABC transporter permease [Fimbriiglobus sp.]
MLRNFIAVMKDSFREARNGWILQTLLILIVLFLLVVFSTSVRPLSFAEQVEHELGIWKILFQFEPTTGRPQVAIENANPKNEGEPWTGGGEFDLSVTFATYKDYESARAFFLPGRSVGRFIRLPVDAKRTEEFLSLNGALKGVSVTDVTPEVDKPKKPAKDEEQKEGGKSSDGAKPVKLRFHVTTAGSGYADKLDWPHELTVFFVVNTGFQRPARSMAYYCQNYVVNGLGGWVFCLVGTIVTAGFIPNLLRKGALDLVIAKPIGRVGLLVYKYVGGLIFFLILVTTAVLGMLLAVGVRTGVWSATFLSVIPLLTLQFAILYSVSTLFGVLTRNALVAIMATLLSWGLFFLIGLVADSVYSRERVVAEVAKQTAEGKTVWLDEDGNPIPQDKVMERLDPNAPLFGFIPYSTAPVWKIVHFVSPRTVQLDTWSGKVIAQGVLSERGMKERGWDLNLPATLGEVIAVNLGFITLMLGLASWRFATRDP